MISETAALLGSCSRPLGSVAGTGAWNGEAAHPDVTVGDAKFKKKEKKVFGHGRIKTLKSVGFPVNVEAHEIWFIWDLCTQCYYIPWFSISNLVR